ncbi:phosphatidylethanolamine N-methyltransferase [Boothiomyces sp. JEL0866]|nr:phosphatidylethanolamine N-methyltransferase [Boothiomyces sp. JEL0866]
MDTEQEEQTFFQGIRFVDGSIFYFPSFTKEFKLVRPTDLELLTIALLIFQILQMNSSKYLLLGSFIFWRVLLVFGLGFVLLQQSKHASIIRFMAYCGLGRNPKKPRSEWANYWIRQITLYMENNTGFEYDYVSMPIEFNSWVLFRQVAFLLISNDLLAYCLFARGFSDQKAVDLDTLEGLKIVLQKIDWGNFFFIKTHYSNEKGSFDKIPHPMYSIGYIGYYGVALLTQSYTVLFISMAGHASHILFLYYIERPQSKKIQEAPEEEDEELQKIKHAYFGHDLTLFTNFNIFRSGDLMTYFIAVYTIVTAWLIGPVNSANRWFYIAQPVFWRVLHTFGLGMILHLQGKNKFWTRLYIKRGGSLKEAFHHWKVLFNLTLTMIYVSLLVTAYRFYKFPESYFNDGEVIKHTLGLLFIVLHSWITTAVYTVLGPIGWFHADYFIDALQGRDKKQTGIYKYLEHPLLYNFSSWGVVLICASWEVFWITLFGQTLHFIFLHLVERPHIDSTYGKNLNSTSYETLLNRSDTATTITDTETVVPTRTLDSDSESIASDSEDDDTLRLKRRKRTDSTGGIVIETIKGVVQELEGLMHNAKPHVKAMVQKTQRGVASIANAARFEDSLARNSLPLHLYTLSIKNTTGTIPTLQFGDPIVIEFTGCRETMKQKDWIGVYDVSQNFDPHITTSTCSTKWMHVSGFRLNSSSIVNSDDSVLFSKTAKGYTFGDTPVELSPSSELGLRLVKGALVYTKQRIPWRTGKFEVRYHYDGKYNVLASSQPFMIELPASKLSEPSTEGILQELTPIISKCVEIYPTLLEPNEGILSRVVVPDDTFDNVTLVQYRRLVSKRIIYAIQEMYKVHFSHHAIETTFSLVELSQKICEALIVLGKEL